MPNVIAEQEDLYTADMLGSARADGIPFQLTEALCMPYIQQIQALEAQLASEQKKAGEAVRMLEVARLEVEQQQKELEDIMRTEKRDRDSQVQGFQRRIASLEAELSKKTEAAQAASSLQWQLSEAEAKVTGLQQILKEHELHSERERALAAEDLKEQVKEAAESRNRAHQLQAQLEHEERRTEQLAAECEELRQDAVKIRLDLDEERSAVKAMRPASEVEDLVAELEQQRALFVSEKRQLENELHALRDKQESLAVAARTAEMKAEQLETEVARVRSEEVDARRMAEQHHRAEVASLKNQLEACQKQAEQDLHQAQSREGTLIRDLDAATVSAEALRTELAQCKAENHELDTHLHQERHQHTDKVMAMERASQQHETEMKAEHCKEVLGLQAEISQKDAELSRKQSDLVVLQDQFKELEQQKKELEGSLESTRRALQRRDHECEVLKAEFTTISSQLESERGQWARDADEAHLAMLKVEEYRRAAAPLQQSLSDDLGSRMELEAAKKSLHRANKKQQDLRHKCQELAKRVSQLQHEKASVIRICEDNKVAFEKQLASMGIAGCSPLLGGRPVSYVQTLASPPQVAASWPVQTVGMAATSAEHGSRGMGNPTTMSQMMSESASRRCQLRTMLGQIEPYMESLRRRQAPSSPLHDDAASS